MPVLSPEKQFHFKKNLSLLNQNASLGFEISADLRPDVLEALKSDTAPFPSRDIELADLTLKASTSKPIEFARGNDKIGFTAAGSAFAGFGVYRSGAVLLKKLGGN